MFSMRSSSVKRFWSTIAATTDPRGSPCSFQNFATPTPSPSSALEKSSCVEMKWLGHSSLSKYSSTTRMSHRPRKGIHCITTAKMSLFLKVEISDALLCPLFCKKVGKLCKYGLPLANFFTLFMQNPQL